MLVKKKIKLIISSIIPIALIISLITPAVNAQDQDTVTATTGTLEKVTMAMPQFTDGRTRTICIWLPDGYNANDKTKKYPVIYMQDGQNIFGLTTCADGWHIDEKITSLMKEGCSGSIIVGIYNGPDRLEEYNPTDENSEGCKYANFIVDTLKPYIDAHYNTNPDRKYNAVGGSSCGGTISYYLAMKHPDVFGFSIIMSMVPLCDYSSYTDNFDFKDTDKMPYLYLYSGGIGTNELTGQQSANSIKSLLTSNGYPDSKIEITFDQNQKHNNDAWSKYFVPAYEWFVSTLTINPENKNSSSSTSKASSSMSSSMSSSIPTSSAPDTESKVSNPNTGADNQEGLIYTFCISIFLLTALVAFSKLNSKVKNN